MYDAGLRYASEGKFKKARSMFQAARKSDPYNTDVKLSMKLIQDVLHKKINKSAAINLFAGLLVKRTEGPVPAIVEFDKAIRAAPDYSRAYVIRGLAYAAKGDYDQAVSDYSEALKIDQEYVKAFIYRGIAYARKDQIDLAVADYNRSIDLDRNNNDAFYNRGLAYTRKGQYDPAVSDFSRAIELNPKYANAYINRGYIYMVYLSDREKGCSDWEAACALGLCNNYTLAKKQGKCK